jgi:hypothetical protein
MGKKYDPSRTEATPDYTITEPRIGNRSDVPDLPDRLIGRANAAARAWNVSGEISAFPFQYVLKKIIQKTLPLKIRQDFVQL